MCMCVSALTQAHGKWQTCTPSTKRCRGHGCRVYTVTSRSLNRLSHKHMCHKVNCFGPDEATYAAPPDIHKHTHAHKVLRLVPSLLMQPMPCGGRRAKSANHTKECCQPYAKKKNKNTDEAEQKSQAVLLENPFPWAAEL